ncbi:SusC/RagA family TonB-linked outer membrane protein [Seonamhaeicola sp. S2-3]|uniref:SusC/RagA family TonB-linked outer membrane protein n=1 Tax=Seonamhaeicola sp. S2-3 TaxID=1936081 RepID=UPI000972CFD7|nr:TonB-dependent receptor [Seonamhaeicola sp. S2-3]APY10863.1 SusC/RagA family TonB-linked outer membrane protein [Seonamhaeicola sp. S2-3]
MIKLKLLGIALVMLCMQNALSQVKTVSGVVSDKNGVPLPGVNVLLKGTKKGTSTDFDGKYTINDVKANSIFVFSYLGYATQEIPYNGKNVLNITLKEDTSKLEEVVVIGYGTSKRKDLTGAISSVSAEELKDQPFSSVDQALTGKAAGVTVSQNSGAPGGGVSIKIRGITSLYGNEPLYVIDGTPVFADRNNTSLDLGTATGGGSGQNVNSALAGLNMSDIESIDILKDASATAIYGANGSNGVVLITTKKGKRGKTTINFDHYTGIQSVAKYYDMMNLQEYAQYTSDLLKSDNRDVPFIFQNPSLLGKGTDWQKEIFRSALVTNNQLSVSGEKNGTRYYTSLGYFRQEGVIVNTDFERISMRLNIETKVNDWFKIGNNISLSNVQQHIVKNDDRGGIVSSALRLSPLIPVRYPDGSYGAPSGGVNGASNNYEAVNPVAYSEYVNNLDKKFKINGNLFAEISFLKHLTFRTELGYDLNAGDSRVFIPTYEDIGTAANEVNSSLKQQDQGYYWTVKNFLTYNNALGKHNINVVLGQESQKSNFEYLRGSRRDLEGNNEFDNLVLGLKSTSEVDNQSFAWAMQSYIARANYNYDSKYYLTASIRADASSNFGPNNKWGYFPSVSGAWTISNENFMKSSSGPINFLKLRAGYGEVGNQNIPSFLYQTQFAAVPSSSGLSYVYTVDGNPDIKWETLKSTNIGLEIGLLDNAIRLDLDLYQKKSSDLLIQRPADDRTAGRVLPYENVGEMLNRGLDLKLNTRNIQTDNFSWNSTFIFSTYSNELTKFYDGTKPLTANIPQSDGELLYSYVEEGESLGQIYGYVTDGIFRTQQEVDESAIQVPGKTSVGDIKFKDLDNDGEITLKDRTYIGSALPKFTYSINNNISYKDFDLSVVINGSYGNKIYNQNRFYTEALRFLGENQSKDALNHFVVNYLPDGVTLDDAANLAQDTDIPRIDLANGNSNTRVSDRFVEDGSYLRIQNITMGYNINSNILSKTNFFTKARVYLSGQNLFTFTKYSGLDPEVGSRNSDIRFAGLDVGRYPLAKTITLGVNLTF